LSNTETYCRIAVCRNAGTGVWTRCPRHGASIDILGRSGDNTISSLSPQGQIILLSALSLVFTFINGFQGSSNVVATMIASRAMSVRRALLLAGAAGFVAPFIFGLAVAETIGKEILDPATMDVEIICAALLGAIVWTGGLIGSVLIARGPQAIQTAGLVKITLALLVSPFAGLLAGYLLMKTILFLCRAASPRVNRLFKRLQILTALALALSRGSNDAQKGMGLIAMSLISVGIQSAFTVPPWAIIACATAIAVGTSIAGIRIIKTVGSKIYRVRPIHGFASQAAAAGVIFSAAMLGGPVSSTQVVSSTVMGVGSAQRVSSVRWRVVNRIAKTWITTIPASAAIAALLYLLIKAF